MMGPYDPVGLDQAYAEWFGVSLPLEGAVDLVRPHWRACTSDPDVLWKYPSDETCWNDGCAGARV